MAVTLVLLPTPASNKCFSAHIQPVTGNSPIVAAENAITTQVIWKTFHLRMVQGPKTSNSYMIITLTSQVICLHRFNTSPTDICTGTPCDRNGQPLPPDAPPPPNPHLSDSPDEPWHPFNCRTEFDFANHHFVKVESSAHNIDTAIDLWAASIVDAGGRDGTIPWSRARDMYATIDEIKHSNTPWETWTVNYMGPLPPGQPPKWMTATYEFSCRNTRQLLHQQLAPSHFKNQTNYRPYRQFNKTTRNRVYTNLMSGDWAWSQAVRITIYFPI